MFKSVLVLLFIIGLTHQKEPYNQWIAAKMIKISTATYYTNTELALKDSCPECYKQFKVSAYVQTISLLSLIGYDPELNNVVVAFRGTDNWENGIIDALALSGIYVNGFSCFGCLVHVGFRDAYALLVRKGLKDKIQKVILRYPGAGVIFTGHSLGGALANYASLKFKESDEGKNRNVLLYTFGQPRIGNSFYSNYHDSLIDSEYRVIHNADLVAHIPARTNFIHLYRHGGQEVWYSDNMTEIIDQCEGDSDECSNRDGIKYQKNDHGSANYVKLYERYEQARLEQIQNDL